MGTKSAGGSFLPKQDQEVSGAWNFLGPARLQTGFVNGVVTETTSAPISNQGVSKIILTSSTGSATKGYTLALPAIGSTKVLLQTTASTGGVATVTCATGAQFNATGNTIATFASAGSLSLIATTSTSWSIVAQTTNVTFS